MKIDPNDLVSTKDIAILAGVRSTAVTNWKSRHSDFPQPIVIVGNGELPLYLRQHVEQYLYGRRRLNV